MSRPQLQGSILFLNLYDICEEIHLEELRRLLELTPSGGEIKFRHPAPEYLGFERPPVVENLPDTNLLAGPKVTTRLKYYDYGVLSVQFESPFAGGWDNLVSLSCRLVEAPEVEQRALALAREKSQRVAPALIKPYDHWLSEDYYVFYVQDIAGGMSAAELLERHGDSIAQIVRGENEVLSEAERREVLQSSMSYSLSDLVVVGWNASFIYDTAPGAEPTLQLLEYANSQLLEFRHYDDVLTRQLNSAYQSLEKGTGFWARWRLAGVSAKLYALLLEVTALAERTDHAMKFFSDMYSARFHRLAANKVGVQDYKELVHRKLATAEGLYKFMVEQFQQGRAFVLELAVVIILIIDLVFLFRGKP